MAKKSAPEQQTPETFDAEDSSSTPPEPAAPRPPQGIVIRYLQTGNSKVDFHRIHRGVPSIDPASLVVDGQDPFLACPKGRDITDVKIVQVMAKDAAYMLTCDPASGGQSRYRLATDAEVEKYRREHAPKKK